MMKKPFLHALAAALYIILIVLAISAVTADQREDTVIIPMAMLSLFVLSAAVMGYLFLSEPLQLFLEGRKQEAVSFFAKTVGIFACFAVVFILLLLLFPGQPISSPVLEELPYEQYEEPIVGENPEGEADPSRMTLGMNKWTWITTKYSDGREVKPKGDKAFILSFNANKTFSLTTDCNGVGGKYQVTGNKIAFNEMISTLMYCEGSLESDFTKMLGDAESYNFTSRGELILDLKSDSGTVILR